MRWSPWRLGAVIVPILIGLPMTAVAIDDYRAPDPMAAGDSPHTLDFALDPTWSPDGTRIAFAGERGGRWGIYVTDADGTAVTRLTEGQAATEEGSHPDTDPAWSPDGTKIAFSGSRGGDAGIYVMDADGTDMMRMLG